MLRILLLGLGLRSMFANGHMDQQPLQPCGSARAACHELQRLFPAQVVLPGDKAYFEGQSTYWTAQQAEIIPTCRFLPQAASHVQSALLVLTTHNTSFAIVSGGHSSNTGASNIELGITVDLSLLSSVDLVDDDKAVWLGPGARWADVFDALEPHGLVVSGGRNEHVGVGGYMLGGGFSWFANQYGWTCDTVIEFEIVTPGGELLNVTKDDHHDLFWALKGSLGAFGIVTAIKVPTIRNTAIFGGVVTYDAALAPTVFNALEDLSSSAPQDLSIQGYISFAWLEKYRRSTLSIIVVDTANNVSSAPLQKFVEIPHQYSGLNATTIGGIAKDSNEGNAVGLRRSKFTLTTTCDAVTLRLVHEVVLKAINTVHFAAEELFGVTYQPLTEPHLRAQTNIFNLAPEDGPLLLLSVEIWWDDTERDQYFEGQMRALHNALVRETSQAGALHPFVYPNYAAWWQNPLDSLDASTKRQLLLVRQRHDPDDIWRRLVPGLWHVKF